MFSKGSYWHSCFLEDTPFQPPKKHYSYRKQFQEQSSYYNEGVKLKKFGEDFLSEENLQEIPSYSQLSDVDIGVPFQSEAEINADNQWKNKRYYFDF